MSELDDLKLPIEQFAVSRTEAIQIVDLKENTEYPFEWTSENLGTAEFIVCPVYKYGKLREFHMYSAQQEKHVHYRHIFSAPPRDWSIGSWLHKDMQPPRIWMFFWCKEHKSNSFRLYVPRGSTHFTVTMMSSFSIDFDNASTKKNRSQS